LPKILSEEINNLKESVACDRLVRVFAEWMVLIELCKDLLSRLETYEISIMMAEMIEGKLEQGWSVERGQGIKKVVKSSFG